MRISRWPKTATISKRTPLIGPVSLLPFLEEGFIEQVICGGENYAGSRPCNYDWVLALHHECHRANVSFSFIEIGSNFVKDGHHYRLGSKQNHANTPPLYLST